MRGLFIGLFCIGCMTAAVGCGGSIATVKTLPRPDPATRPVRVPHPPPPAKVEVIPVRRSSKCSYLDGHWDYRNAEWQWIKGAWVRPPKGCVYSPPRTRFEESTAGTTLLYRRGEWYRPGEPGMCEPAEPCDRSTSAVVPQ